MLVICSNPGPKHLHSGPLGQVLVFLPLGVMRLLGTVTSPACARIRRRLECAAAAKNGFKRFVSLSLTTSFLRGDLIVRLDFLDSGCRIFFLFLVMKKSVGFLVLPPSIS